MNSTLDGVTLRNGTPLRQPEKAGGCEQDPLNKRTNVRHHHITWQPASASSTAAIAVVDAGCRVYVAGWAGVSDR